MSTNSVIGVVINGKIKAVYCHWDGYVSYVGRILVENYDQRMTERLVMEGDISVLGETIGIKHDFDTPVKGSSTFYGRDRGESNIEAVIFDTAEAMLEHHEGCEFFYILGTDGVWYFSEGKPNDWKRVDSELVLVSE